MRKDQWKSRTKSGEDAAPAEEDSDVETTNPDGSDPLSNDNGTVDPFDELLSAKAAETTPAKKSNGLSVTFEKEESSDDDDDKTDDTETDDTSPAKKKDKNDSTATDDADADADADGDGDGDGDGGYEVEDIVDHKYKGKKKLYKIRWKGYTEADDTWEKEDSLSCAEIVEKYLEKHPDTRPPPKEKKEKKEKKPKKEPAVAERSTPKRAAAERKSLAEDSDGGEEEKKSPEKKKKDKKGKGRGRPQKKAEYEVEKIVDHEMRGKQRVFRIRWKGYGAKDDTYEPESSLNCPDKIKQYLKTVKEEEDNTDYVVEKVIGVKVEKGAYHYLLKWKGWPDATWEPEKMVDCKDLVDAFYATISTKIGGGKKRTASTAKLGSKKTPKGKKARKSYQKNGYDDSDDNESEEQEEEQDDDDDEEEEEEEVEQITPDEDTEREWEVQKVVNVRTKKGKKEYLIRWKGCKPQQDTWEPAKQVNCPELIAEFMKKNKKK